MVLTSQLRRHDRGDDDDDDVFGDVGSEVTVSSDDEGDASPYRSAQTKTLPLKDDLTVIAEQQNNSKHHGACPTIVDHETDLAPEEPASILVDESSEELDPCFVPRGQKYFLHDDRSNVDGPEAPICSDAESEVNPDRPDIRRKFVAGQRVNTPNTGTRRADDVPLRVEDEHHSQKRNKPKTLWDPNNRQNKKWEHDRFHELLEPAGHHSNLSPSAPRAQKRRPREHRRVQRRDYRDRMAFGTNHRLNFSKTPQETDVYAKNEESLHQANQRHGHSKKAWVPVSQIPAKPGDPPQRIDVVRSSPTASQYKNNMASRPNRGQKGQARGSNSSANVAEKGGMKITASRMQSEPLRVNNGPARTNYWPSRMNYGLPHISYRPPRSPNGQSNQDHAHRVQQGLLDCRGDPPSLPKHQSTLQGTRPKSKPENEWEPFDPSYRRSPGGDFRSAEAPTSGGNRARLPEKRRDPNRGRHEEKLTGRRLHKTKHSEAKQISGPPQVRLADKTEDTRQAKSDLLTAADFPSASQARPTQADSNFNPFPYQGSAEGANSLTQGVTQQMVSYTQTAPYHMGGDNVQVHDLSWQPQPTGVPYSFYMQHHQYGFDNSDNNYYIQQNDNPIESEAPGYVCFPSSANDAGMYIFTSPDDDINAHNAPQIYTCEPQRPYIGQT